MRKLIKFIIVVIGILLLLAVLGATLLIIFFNPNNLKPRISQQAYKLTGRTLTFSGDLHWTFFPEIGIKLGSTQLSNPANFNVQPFARVEKATIAIRLLPLLEGKVQAGELSIDSLTLNLITNSNGQTNWQNLTTQNKTTVASKTSAINSSSSTANSSWSFYIPKIDIKNANITWNNQQTNQLIQITQLNLSASEISPQKNFPLNMSFTIDSNQPQLNGKFSLTSDVLPDFSKNTYQFDNLQLETQLQSKQLPLKKISLQLKGNVAITQNSLTASSVNLALNGTTVQGNFSINNFSSPIINFSLQADLINLNPYLALTNNSPKSAITPVAPKNAVNNTTLPTNNTNLTLQGKIQIGQLIVKKLVLQKLNATISLKNNNLKISPLMANLYGGNYNGNVNYNLQQSNFSTQSSFSNLRVENLLSDLANSTAISGIGNLQLNINSKGTDKNTILRNLNGNLKLIILQGNLKGIDLFYIVSNAFNLLNQNISSLATGLNPLNIINSASKIITSTLKPTNQTQFSTLSTTGNIQNGILNNNDLLLLSPSFQVAGQGNVNFVNEQINYLLQGTLVKNGKLNDQHIPIRVTGTLTNPKIQLKLDEVLKNTLKNQLSPIKQIQGVATDLQNLPSVIKNLSIFPKS